MWVAAAAFVHHSIWIFVSVKYWIRASVRAIMPVCMCMVFVLFTHRSTWISVRSHSIMSDHNNNYNNNNVFIILILMQPKHKRIIIIRHVKNKNESVVASFFHFWTFCWLKTSTQTIDEWKMESTNYKMKWKIWSSIG